MTTERTTESVAIRVANPHDAPALLAVYGPVVRDTAISFEFAVPTEQEFARRIAEGIVERPWLVAVTAGSVDGYAYAGPFRARPAYQWSVEVSVYVAESARGRGVGRRLYERLLRIVRYQGYVSAYAGITLPNPASVRLHETMGFRPVGVFERAGFKLGAWHDVGWWQLPLASLDGPPDPPRRFTDLDGLEVKTLIEHPDNLG